MDALLSIPFGNDEKNGSGSTLERSFWADNLDVLSKPDPVTTVSHYIDAFNRADIKAMAACFAVPGSILDGLAPHVWQGPTACQDWYRDVLIAGEHEGATDYSVTIGTPLHANVTGDSAYVVVPASMTFKVHGKQVTQSGATFTVALRGHEDGWRISAWAWAKGTPKAS